MLTADQLILYFCMFVIVCKFLPLAYINKSEPEVVNHVKPESLTIEKINQQYYAYADDVFMVQNCSLRLLVDDVCYKFPNRFFVFNKAFNSLNSVEQVDLLLAISESAKKST